MAANHQLSLPPMPVNSLDHNRQSVSGTGQRELTELLAESVTAAGCTDKEAAYAQGIDPAHWSRIKSGEKTQHLDRIARLPERVQREFVTRYARQLKMTVSDDDARKRAVAELVKAAAHVLSEIA